MQGKTVVITGGTSGVGLEAASVLAGRGASLILVGRDLGRGAAAVDRLAKTGPAPRFLSADLSSLAEVRRLAGEILDIAPRIDVLINNAGAWNETRRVTAEGPEQSFATNHLAYFLLTILLLDRLRESAPSRVVSVASMAHRGVRLDFDDLQMARRYKGWTAYRRSKLANILFTRELARRLEGSGVTANCLHPGFVATRFGDNNDTFFGHAFGLLKRAVAITPAQGAETILYLAASLEAASFNGRYFADSRPATPSSAGRNDAAARRLWEESAKLCEGKKVGEA